MIARILVITLLAAGFGLVAPADDTAPLPQIVGPVTADEPSTCDGWPYPVAKILDECPHGPRP